MGDQDSGHWYHLGDISIRAYLNTKPCPDAAALCLLLVCFGCECKPTGNDAGKKQRTIQLVRLSVPPFEQTVEMKLAGCSRAVEGGPPPPGPPLLRAAQNGGTFPASRCAGPSAAAVFSFLPHLCPTALLGSCLVKHPTWQLFTAQDLKEGLLNGDTDHFAGLYRVPGLDRSATVVLHYRSPAL
jgi:hypothetical protein